MSSSSPDITLNIDNETRNILERFYVTKRWKDLYVFSKILVAQQKFNINKTSQYVYDAANYYVKVLEEKGFSIEPVINHVKNEIAFEKSTSECGTGKMPDLKGECAFGWYMEKSGNKCCKKKVFDYETDQNNKIVEGESRLKDTNNKLLAEYRDRFGIENNNNDNNNRYYKLRKNENTSARLKQLAFDKRKREEKMDFNQTRVDLETAMSDEKGEPWNILGLSRDLFNYFLNAFESLMDFIEWMATTDFTHVWILTCIFKILIIYLCLTKCKNIDNKFLKAFMIFSKFSLYGIYEIGYTLLVSVALTAIPQLLSTFFHSIMGMFNLANLAIKIARLLAGVAVIYNMYTMLSDVYLSGKDWMNNKGFTLCSQTLRSFFNMVTIELRDMILNFWSTSTGVIGEIYINIQSKLKDFVSSTMGDLGFASVEVSDRPATTTNDWINLFSNCEKSKAGEQNWGQTFFGTMVDDDNDSSNIFTGAGSTNWDGNSPV
jgi:hypothetical protein